MLNLTIYNGGGIVLAVVIGYLLYKLVRLYIWRKR